MTVYRTWAETELTPAAWRADQPPGGYFITNPAIQRDPRGDQAAPWIMAYKVVTPRYHHERFAACRLDAAWQVVPGSVVPLSDTIPNVTTQVGDPRLVVYAGRLWAIYGHFRLPSLLYLVEIDPTTLAAAGPARPLLLDDRQWQEKNWMLFEHAGELLAVYTIAPHVILHLDLRGQEAIHCRRIHTTSWDVGAYARRFGEPRGGAPPVRVGDHYHVFFHSRAFTHPAHAALAPAWHCVRAGLGRPEHWQGPRLANGDVRPLQQAPIAPAPRLRGVDRLIRLYEQRFARRHYYAGYYAFAAQPPFAPVALAQTPVIDPTQEPLPTRQDRLSPLNDRVVFPSGAVQHAGQWWVSYGVHDERCVMRALPAPLSPARSVP